MNWFTSKFVGNASSEAKKEIASGMAVCDHVAEDHNLLYRVDAENDSFGSESYGMCKECAEETTRAENDKLYVCVDCKKDFPLKEGSLWRWWGFYAPQGDEPLPICDACERGEKHLRRLHADKVDREYDLGIYPPESDDDDDDYY